MGRSHPLSVSSSISRGASFIHRRPTLKMMATNFAVLAVVLFSLMQMSAGLKKFSPESTPVHDCSNEADRAKILSVRLTDCEAAPCELIKGTQRGIEIEFEPKHSSAQMHVQIRGIIAGVPVPWAVPGGCASCPSRISPVLGEGECVKAGTKHTFSLSIPIQTSYPSIRVGIQMVIKDDEDRKHICLRIPAVIKNAPSLIFE